MLDSIAEASSFPWHYFTIGKLANKGLQSCAAAEACAQTDVAIASKLRALQVPSCSACSERYMLSQESHYYTSSVTWLIPGPWDYSLVQQHGSTSQAAQKDQLKIKAALSLALPGSNKQCMEKVHFFPLSLSAILRVNPSTKRLKTQWNNSGLK